MSSIFLFIYFNLLNTNGASHMHIEWGHPLWHGETITAHLPTGRMILSPPTANNSFTRG